MTLAKALRGLDLGATEAACRAAEDAIRAMGPGTWPELVAELGTTDRRSQRAFRAFHALRASAAAGVARQVGAGIPLRLLVFATFR